ncbi:MAG: hypothetical protein J5685_12745 [Clostridiales bacterium]|nr:hypothetical protein [Clostridiales bacterium]
MRKTSYMTARSAVYMCMLILSILLFPVTDGKHILQVLVLAGVILLWSLTFRFFLNPKILPLNIFCNTVLVALPSSLPFFDLGTETYVAMLPLAMGLTAMTSMNADRKSVYERPDATEEVLIPSLTAFGVGVASCSIYIIAERKLVSIAIIISALLLMLLSVLYKKFTGREKAFTSSAINDIRTIPGDDRANLKSFVSHRLIIFISAVILEVGLVFSLKIPDIYPFTLFDPKPLVCAILALILSLVFSRKIKEKSFGGGFYPYEIIIAFGVLILPFLIGDPVYRNVAIPLAPALFTLADMLVTGFLCTYKRRRLSAVRHYYSEGIPLLMLLLGILIMAVEEFAQLVM